MTSFHVPHVVLSSGSVASTITCVAHRNVCMCGSMSKAHCTGRRYYSGTLHTAFLLQLTVLLHACAPSQKRSHLVHASDSHFCTYLIENFPQCFGGFDLDMIHYLLLHEWKRRPHYIKSMILTSSVQPQTMSISMGSQASFVAMYFAVIRIRYSEMIIPRPLPRTDHVKSQLLYIDHHFECISISICRCT